MILRDSVQPARACIEVTQGIFKDFMQGPLARISPGSPQDLLVKGHLADLTRSFYNSLPRACPKSFHRSTANTGHNDRDPTRTKRPPKTYKGTRGLSDLLMYFAQFLHAPRKVKVEHVKRHVFARFQPIFRRDLSNIAPETESQLRAPEVLRLPCAMNTKNQIQKCRQSHTTSVSIVQVHHLKFRACK